MLDPRGLEVVVVVVVLHAPRRCASGPHVDVVPSDRSNDTFCASIVDERGGAGDPITTNVAPKRRRTRRLPRAGRTIRPEFSGPVRTRPRPRGRVGEFSRCGHRGNGYSLRVARSVPIGSESETLSVPKNLLNIVDIGLFAGPGREFSTPVRGPRPGVPLSGRRPSVRLGTRMSTRPRRFGERSGMACASNGRHMFLQRAHHPNHERWFEWRSDEPSRKRSVANLTRPRRPTRSDGQSLRSSSSHN